MDSGAATNYVFFFFIKRHRELFSGRLGKDCVSTGVWNTGKQGTKNKKRWVCDTF